MSSSSVTFRALKRNAPYIHSEFSALLDNLSFSVKSICICVICSYLLSFWKPAVDALSVTPGHLLPPSFRIWTLFSSPFLEIHFWEVIVDILTVGLCGKLIEPLWGPMEMSLFFVLVNLSVSFLSVAYYVVLYMATSDPDTLFSIQIHGLSGYIAAVTVAVRQIMPDNVILRTPLGKLTNRNIPLTVLVISIIAWAIGLLEGVYCTMFGSGIVISWIYLRFYQRHSNGSRGDTADSFNFASFFPNVLQPAIGVMANSMFDCFVKMGLCRKQVKRFADAGGPSSIQISFPGQDQSDAERRRQKALKLLSERLNSSSSSSRKDDKQPLLLNPSSDHHDIDIPTPSSSSSINPPNLINLTSPPSSISKDNVVLSMTSSSSTSSTLNNQPQPPPL